ncbi:MAG: HAD family phosphatase [Chthoniobacterales bacterium]
MLTLPPGPFEAFIFDVDGTIADTMPLHFDAWTHALGKWSAFFPEDVFYSLGGTKTDRVAEIVRERANADFDVTEIVLTKEKYFLHHLGEAVPIQPVIDVIEQWRGKIPMAVASGGFRRVIEEILRGVKLEGCFDAMVAAEDVVHGKPDPEPFLKAAAMLGVDPTKCLVFEDSPTGIAAALAAGMAWVEVTRETR